MRCRWIPALGASEAVLLIEDTPAVRLKIEQRRRDAMKAAEAGLAIKLPDLT